MASAVARIRLATVDDCASLARVRIDSWRSAYAGIVSDEYLAQLTYAEQAQDWRAVFKSHPDDLIYVAENNAIVGLVWARIDHNEASNRDAEVLSLHVEPSLRGQGIGRRLMQTVAGALRERGSSSLMLWVLEDNRNARLFYEHLGGVLFDRHFIELGNETLAEVAYRWEDVRSLCDIKPSESAN